MAHLNLYCCLLKPLIHAPAHAHAHTVPCCCVSRPCLFANIGFLPQPCSQLPCFMYTFFPTPAMACRADPCNGLPPLLRWFIPATTPHVLEVVGCLLPGRLIVFTPTRVEEADHALSKYCRLGISSPLLCSPCISCFSKADRSWRIRVAIVFSFLRLRWCVLGLSFLARIILVICGASSAILKFGKIADSSRFAATTPLTYAVLCSNWEHMRSWNARAHNIVAPPAAQASPHRSTTFNTLY